MREAGTAMWARQHLGGQDEHDDATVRAFRELTDLEAIRALKARYFRYLDTKQWERLRAVFVDDLETDGFWAKGRDADEFVASLAENLKAVRSVHLGSMPEISILGPEDAQGIWAMSDYLEWEPDASRYRGRGAPGQRGVRGYGHYEESYRRGANGWQISFMRLTRLRIDPIFEIPGPDPGDWLPSGASDWLEGDK